jgi:ankyrin repeat protein
MNTQLIEAAKQGQLDKIKKLIELGANIHSINDRALRLAAYHGHIEVINVLISKGADVHAENDEAIRVASRRGQIKVVKLLIKAGANVNINKYGNKTPLQEAVWNGHIKLAKFLIENGAHKKQLYSVFKEAVEDNELDIFNQLIELGVDIHYDNDKALLIAIKNYHVDILNRLFELYGDFSSLNETLSEHLYDAFAECIIFSKYEIVEILIKAGIDVHRNNDLALKLAAITASQILAVLQVLSEGESIECLIKTVNVLISAGCKATDETISIIEDFSRSVNVDLEDLIEILKKSQ